MIGNKRIEIARANEEKPIRELLDSCYPRVKRFFVLAYDDTKGDNQVFVDSFKKYFLPRVKIKTFFDQPSNDSIKHYVEVRKVSTGQGDDYTTGLIGFCLFQKQLQINGS